MTPFIFTPRDPEQDTAVGFLSVHDECSALASASVNNVSKPAPTPSYAEQCAALALYRQTVARYLADVDAVEGDQCFWTAMGDLHREGRRG
jgi:hypothetical protein